MNIKKISVFILLLLAVTALSPTMLASSNSNCFDAPIDGPKMLTISQNESNDNNLIMPSIHTKDGFLIKGNNAAERESIIRVLHTTDIPSIIDTTNIRNRRARANVDYF